MKFEEDFPNLKNSIHKGHLEGNVDISVIKIYCIEKQKVFDAIFKFRKRFYHSKACSKNITGDLCDCNYTPIMEEIEKLEKELGL